MSVFQTFLEAAEGMLKENVVGNRAVGSYGVNILQSHIRLQESVYFDILQRWKSCNNWIWHCSRYNLFLLC